MGAAIVRSFSMGRIRSLLPTQSSPRKDSTLVGPIRNTGGMATTSAADPFMRAQTAFSGWG